MRMEGNEWVCYLEKIYLEIEPKGHDLIRG